MENNSAKDARDNSQVSKLWKDYEAARKADRPQKQLDILQDIKRLAAKERLPWDFYRAGDEFVNVSSSRNWKLRDSLYKQFQEDIASFDEPVLTFYNSRYNLAGKSEFLKANRSRLEKGRHTDFYEHDESFAQEVYEDVLVESIRNDWEYVLWSLVTGHRWDPGTVREYAGLLEQALSDRYPEAAFLEFTEIEWINDDFRSKERLEEYARKYDGKAVALMARQALLSMEFENLDEKGTSEQYKAIRDKAAAFEKDRKAFSGQEKKIADCCTEVKSLIEQLDSKSVWFEIHEGLLKARLRNQCELVHDLRRSRDREGQGEESICRKDRQPGQELLYRGYRLAAASRIRRRHIYSGMRERQGVYRTGVPSLRALRFAQGGRAGLCRLRGPRKERRTRAQSRLRTTGQ